MTLPQQSNRAVAATRKFLVRLSSPYGANGIKGIRREVRAEALRLLRHYPFAWNGDCPDEDNAAIEDNTPAANATPRAGSEQSGCTLTEAEREAASRIELLEAADKCSASALAVINGGFQNAVAEIARLNLAIRRLADQDATLSVQDGNVTVTMDATLTDEEREAGGLIAMHLDYAGRDHLAATLRGLLERTKGGQR